MPKIVRSQIDKNLHTKLVDIYYNWYSHKFGVAPRIGGAEGFALYKTIDYLRELTKNDDERVETGFKLIFEHWEKLETFFQARASLNQIDHFLPDIIRQLRTHGKTKANSQANDYRSKL